MSNTRILVTGRYSNPNTYVLYKDDGTVFQVVNKGEPFEIDNQFRPWLPVKVPKKNGNGTILLCRKYGDGGNVIEEFPLIHNKRGLWALTAGAARNGVFHNYHEPQNAIEKALEGLGVSRNVVEHRDIIDIALEVGGQLCHHVTNKHGYDCLTDGKTEDITEPLYVNDHPNHFHVGCMESTYKIRVHDATYVVYYEINTSMNGTVYKHLQNVIVTPNANENDVVDAIKDLKENNNEVLRRKRERI